MTTSNIYPYDEQENPCKCIRFCDDIGDPHDAVCVVRNKRAVDKYEGDEVVKEIGPPPPHRKPPAPEEVRTEKVIEVLGICYVCAEIKAVASSPPRCESCQSIIFPS